ncbi:MAG: LPS-assembly protein LptD [Negativicutes bacterium]|nr:LPS-assembly protein LptD [Negativicutes bacterium]
MRKRKKTAQKAFVGLAAAIMTFNAYTAADAAVAVKKDKLEQKQVQAPLVIEAERLYFSDLSGDMHAEGKVVITQNQDQILADLIRGNSKQTTVWIDGKATLLQPGEKVNITGERLEYNYQTQAGTMQTARGLVDSERVSAQNISVNQNKVVLYNGTMTKCPAEVPDYHISARKVEIWPGEKMIAYDAKVWLKGKIIYSVPKYQRKLNKDQSEMPQIGYSDKDGFMLKQSLSYPLSPKAAVAADLVYYTKTGFKPVFSLDVDEKMFSWAVTAGHFRDADDDWIKKSPDFSLASKAMRLGDSPVSVKFSGSAGKWTGLRGSEVQESWHQDYKLYFSRDPLKLNKTSTLYLGTGLQYVAESADDSAKTIRLFDAGISTKWSPKVSTWLGYNFASDTAHYFNYGGIDYTKQWVYGLTVTPDRLNAVSYTQVYDIDNSRVKDVYYTWNHNLHCWQLTVTFHTDKVGKKDEITWKLHTVKW